MRFPISSLKSRWALGAFMVAWAWLDTFINLRFPAAEIPFWYPLPAVDCVVVLCVFAWCARKHYALGGWIVGILTGAFVLLRAFRFADGITQQNLHRPFSLYFDLPLGVEFVRLFAETMTRAQFWLTWIGVALGFCVLGWLTLWAFRVAYGALAFGLVRRVFLAAVIVFALLGAVPTSAKFDDLATGWFGQSAVARLASEIAFIGEAPRYVASRRAFVNRAQEALKHVPSDLGGLRQADVHLIYVESYGETLLEHPAFRDTVLALYQQLTPRLVATGWTMASAVIDSPTYGSGSWLAHATMETGVLVDNQTDYDLLHQWHPQTLAGYMRGAGYRSVLVQPGTKRPWNEGQFAEFDQKYRATDFDYHGPTFGWSLVPDQFVLDFVRRRELVRTPRPLFIEYALTSSHAPWNDTPPVIADWTELGDGEIYRRLEGTEYPTTWATLSSAHGAYLASIVYDLEILTQYLEQLDRKPSLMIVLGDHQPTSAVTGASPDRGVPIHVLSRNPALIDPFLRLGYLPGLPAGAPLNRFSMQTFLCDFLASYSSVGAGAG